MPRRYHAVIRNVKRTQASATSTPLRHRTRHIPPPYTHAMPYVVTPAWRVLPHVYRVPSISMTCRRTGTGSELLRWLYVDPVSIGKQGVFPRRISCNLYFII